MLVDGSRVGINRKLGETLESRGFRFSRTKNKYMRCNLNGVATEVNLEGHVVPTRDTFLYFRTNAAKK
jgi:hypothetical protein